MLNLQRFGEFETTSFLWILNSSPLTIYNSGYQLRVWKALTVISKADQSIKVVEDLWDYAIYSLIEHDFFK